MMKKNKFMLVAVALLMSPTAFAQTSTKKNDLGTTIGNMLEGIFTRSNLEISDLAGEYESVGPAVTFKGDSFLKKAGGIAGAATLETKLQPYYEQYGLIGMPMSIDKDGNFILKVKKINIKGTLEKNDEDGTFIFNIMMGGMRLGKFTAYIEKTGRNLDLMFDATKLKELISTIGNLSGIKMAKTLASLLDSYDGACVGFQMNCISSEVINTPADTNESDSVSSPTTGVGGLLELLKKRS